MKAVPRRIAPVGRASVPLLALVAITLLGAFLRRYHLGAAGLWYDELAEATVAVNGMGDLIAGVRAHAAAAPLDYLGLKMMVSIFGPTTLATRAWAFSTGVAAIPAAALLATHVFGRRSAAPAAGFLVATSPFLIAYSQDARFYSSSTLLLLLCLLAFQRAITVSRMGDWVLFGGLAAAALYNYYFLAIPLAACGGALATTLVMERAHRGRLDPGWRRRAIGFLLALGAAATAFAPWVLYALPAQSAATYPYSGPGDFSPAALAGILAGVLAPASGGVDAWWQPVVTAVLLLAAAIGFWVARSRGPVVWAMALTPVLLVPAVWIADARSSYFLAARQFILVAPVVYVLASGAVAWVAARLSPPGGRLTATIALAAAFVWGAFMVPALQAYYSGLVASRPAWERAADYVAARVCPGSTVYVNMSKGLMYGVGYSQPALVARGHELVIDAAHTSPDAIRALSLQSQDIVVLWLNYWVTRGNSLSAVSRQLTQLGYTHVDYPQIRVYTPASTCKPRG